MPGSRDLRASGCDCADMMVTMCRTDTMTDRTIAIDSGRYFH
jgi:3-oxoacyl-[acyl-carrier protein] reductase